MASGKGCFHGVLWHLRLHYCSGSHNKDPSPIIVPYISLPWIHGVLYPISSISQRKPHNLLVAIQGSQAFLLFPSGHAQASQIAQQNNFSLFTVRSSSWSRSNETWDYILALTDDVIQTSSPDVSTDPEVPSLVQTRLETLLPVDCLSRDVSHSRMEARKRKSKCWPFPLCFTPTPQNLIRFSILVLSWCPVWEWRRNTK